MVEKVTRWEHFINWWRLWRRSLRFWWLWKFSPVAKAGRNAAIELILVDLPKTFRMAVYVEFIAYGTPMLQAIHAVAAMFEAGHIWLPGEGWIPGPDALHQLLSDWTDCAVNKNEAAERTTSKVDRTELTSAAEAFEVCIEQLTDCVMGRTQEKIT